MYHYRSTRKQYHSYPKTATCQFCDRNEIQVGLVSESKHAYVIKNRTFYDMWELCRVTDHLLVVPKEHVTSVSDLSDAAKADIMTVIGEYEKTDYNAYARGATNGRRSVIHQHTHLIKTNHKQARFFMMFRRPYFMIHL